MSEGTNSRVGGRKLLRVVAMGQIGNAPYIGDNKHNGEKWVRFGRHNLFPEFVRGLSDNCAPLDACVERMAQYIAGDGFEFLDANEKPIPEAMRMWDRLCGDVGAEALMEGTSLDIALMNTFSWEVIMDGTGRPASVRHMDVCRVRSGKKVDGLVKEFYFSSNWEKCRDKAYEPVPIDAWGETGKGKVLIYRRAYKQLRDYYGEPHWMAAMADAEVLVRIPVFNRTQIQNGFKPAIHAHLTTNRDDADTAEIDENFEMVFTGADGKSYVLTVGAVGESLQITKLERGDHAGELDKTRAVSKEEIYHSYGIPPILMGVDVSTGLSGKGLAIEETLSMFQTMNVAPKQKSPSHAAKMVLQACGIDVPIVRIKQRVPFQPAKDPVLNRQTYLARTTVEEDRIANGLEPFGDERDNMLLCDVLKGAGNLDPVVPNA